MDNFQPLDWQVEKLRVTAFSTLSDLAEISDITWWADVVGEQPEHSLLQPRQGSIEQVGPFEDGQLLLAVRQNRINWLFKPIVDNDESPLDFPMIGPLDEVLDLFIPHMRNWLATLSPTLSRLAFGAVLLCPVSNKESGYRELDRFLPNVQLDPENISDFLFQINRPRRSTTQIEGLIINRLSKWSVASLRRFDVVVGPEQGRVTPSQENSACRLELDINTSQYFTNELSQENLTEVFDELLILGREIVAQGDMP